MRNSFDRFMRLVTAAALALSMSPASAFADTSKTVQDASISQGEISSQTTESETFASSNEGNVATGSVDATVSTDKNFDSGTYDTSAFSSTQNDAYGTESANSSQSEEVALVLAKIVASCVSVDSLDDRGRALWLHDWAIDNLKYDPSSLNDDPEVLILGDSGNGKALLLAYAMLLDEINQPYELLKSDQFEWISISLNGEDVPVDIIRDAQYVFEGGTDIDQKHRFFGVNPGDEAQQPEDSSAVDPSADDLAVDLDEANSSDDQSEPDEASISAASTDEGGDANDGAVANSDTPEGLVAVVSADQKTVTVSATGAKFAQASDVLFPTWSSVNGQDDIKWYSAVREGDTWTARISVSDHKSTGVYYIHSYGTVGGTQVFLDAAEFEISAPAADVSISQTDEQIARGVFTLSVDVSNCPSGVVSLQAPTWSVAGGQDDIVWYAMPRPAEGDPWTMEIPCLSPNRDAGDYISHIYITTGNAIFSWAGQCMKKVEAGPSVMDVVLSADERSVKITAYGADFAKATEVSFAVWSLADGQDDLIWYSGVRNSRNEWVADASVNSHRSVGTYAVHSYAIVGGVQRFTGAGDFSISQTQAKAEISQTDEQKARSVFQLSVDVLNCPSGVAIMQAPTWSVAGGQDDIVWYSVSRPASGDTWTVEIPCVAPDRDPGEYISHIYVTTNNGVFSMVAAAQGDAEAGEDHLEAVPSADELHVTLRAYGAGFAKADSLMLPTWSDVNGQDDIVWYSATRKDAGWEVMVPISNHRNSGTYSVHAYTTQGAQQLFKGATTFSIQATAASASITQTDDQVARGVFQVNIDVTTCPSGVAMMQAPTWSAAGGQDDIVWYAVNRPASGNTWTVEVPCAAPDRDPGRYISHIYVTTRNGIFSCAACTEGDAELGPEHIEANVSDDEMNAVITAYGGNFAKASSMLMPTWSIAGGQDDIIWYDATRIAAGWQLVVPITNHRSAGGYIVHTYGVVKGEQQYISGASFDITAPSADVSIKKTGNGNYTVSVSNFVSPSGISDVLVPSWTEAGGQDDIVWHNASRTGDDIWECTIEAGEHGCQDGVYISHVYATAMNGVQVYVGGLSQNVTASDYLYVTGEQGSGKRVVWLKNPSVSGAVQMPTWTDAGGQDDIVWYSAQDMGSGLWSAEINCGNLRHTGSVSVHVYAGGQMIGATSFYVTEYDIAFYRGVSFLTSVISSASSGFATFNTNYDLNSPAGRWLQGAISNVRSGGRNLGIVMIDLKTGKGFAYNADSRIYCASSIKGPYVAAINKFYPWAVGSSVANTMYSTITVSSNDGYASLRSQFGASPMAEMQAFVGGCSFPAYRNYYDMTAKDLAKLWVGCYDYFYENTNWQSAWCRNLYTNPLLSFIHSALGNRYTTHTKPGWIASSAYYTARNDAGIVMAGDRPYVVAVLSSAYGRDSALIDLVNAIDAVHADMVR